MFKKILHTRKEIAMARLIDVNGEIKQAFFDHRDTLGSALAYVLENYARLKFSSTPTDVQKVFGDIEPCLINLLYYLTGDHREKESCSNDLCWICFSRCFTDGTLKRLFKDPSLFDRLIQEKDL